jgi:hypothetical protein
MMKLLVGVFLAVFRDGLRAEITTNGIQRYRFRGFAAHAWTAEEHAHQDTRRWKNAPRR